MGIQRSVGRSCVNERADAKMVQASLNLVENDKFSLEEKLSVDGSIGKSSFAAIESFQATVMAMKKSTPRSASPISWRRLATKVCP